MKKYQLIVLCLIALLLSACPLIAGTVDSVRRAGLTEGSRKTLLQPAVSSLNDAIGWGDITTVLTMVTESYRNELRDKLLEEKDKVKVIESRVDLMEFEDSAYKATVFITMKAYEIPYYVAEPVKQIQYWEFSLTDGWRLAKRE